MINLLVLDINISFIVFLFSVVIGLTIFLTFIFLLFFKNKRTNKVRAGILVFIIILLSIILGLFIQYKITGKGIIEYL